MTEAAPTRRGRLAPSRAEKLRGQSSQAAPPRRRRLSQARRLPRPRRPLRRYVGPLLVAGLALAIGARLLIGSQPSPIPAPVPTEQLAQSTAAEVPLAVEAVRQPDAPPPDPRAVAQLRMREAVFAPFRGLPSRFGIAVKDLGSGLTVLLNETFPFQAASLYKVPVMYEVFKLRDYGVLSFREELTIGPEDAAYDLGSLVWPIGTRITVGTALERMITISDNSSAFMLVRRVGTWRVNEDAVDLGMYQTRIQGAELSTSALDMLKLLELIASGKAIDASTSAEMVHLMARQQVRDRIPQYLPPEVPVANKTGNWEGATHDVGIVYAPRSTLAMVFLSDGTSDAESVSTAMAQAARNLYDVVNDPSFATAPEPPFPPSTYAVSYAAPPRLPPPTSVPTRAIAPAAAPTRTTAPATSATGATQPAAQTPAPTTRPTQREQPPAPTATTRPTDQPPTATAPPAAPTATAAPEQRATNTPKPSATPRRNR